MGSLKKNTALEYSTRVVQEGDRRCKKSTLNDLAYLTPLRIPLMNPVPVMESSDLAQHTVGRHGPLAALPVRLERREIIYCKRAILSLSSSKILTTHPPLRLASVSSPPTKAGGYTLAGRRGGWGGGVNILEDGRDRIALLQ